MSKLSQTNFGQLLQLANEADIEQLADLQVFINADAAAKQLILKLVTKSAVTRSFKGGVYIETPTAPKTTKRAHTGGRVAKPFEAVGPQEDFKMQIPFSVDGFESWMKSKNIKTASAYATGMRSLLKLHGMEKLNEITLFALSSFREMTTSNTTTTKRYKTWLKKFNEYLLHEAQKKRGATKPMS